MKRRGEEIKINPLKKCYLFLLLPFLCAWLAVGPNVFAEMELDATENTPESSLLATDTNPSEENLEITDSEEQNEDSESDMNQQRAANPIEPADSGEYQYTAKEVGETNGLIQFGQRQFDVIYGGLMCGGTSIANKEKPEEPKTRDLHVTKTWELQGGELPVQQIEVELYRNGVATGQTLTLSASNEGQGVFRNLPQMNPADSAEYQYTAKEVGETNGLIQFDEREFDVTYTGTMSDGFTIKNKENPTTPADIPEEPGEPEEPPTPPETPEEPSAPEIPRKQLPPTGEVMNGYVIIGFLLLMNSIIMLTWVNHSKKY